MANLTLPLPWLYRNTSLEPLRKSVASYCRGHGVSVRFRPTMTGPRLIVLSGSSPWLQRHETCYQVLSMVLDFSSAHRPSEKQQRAKHDQEVQHAIQRSVEDALSAHDARAAPGGQRRVAKLTASEARSLALVDRGLGGLVQVLPSQISFHIPEELYPITDSEQLEGLQAGHDMSKAKLRIPAKAMRDEVARLRKCVALFAGKYKVTLRAEEMPNKNVFISITSRYPAGGFPKSFISKMLTEIAKTLKKSTKQTLTMPK